MSEVPYIPNLMPYDELADIHTENAKIDAINWIMETLQDINKRLAEIEAELAEKGKQ